MSADALEAMAASATLALRARFAPSRHCAACGAKLPYRAGRGRPRRWCDTHHPRPARLQRRAPEGAQGRSQRRHAWEPRECDLAILAGGHALGAHGPHRAIGGTAAGPPGAGARRG